MPPQRMRSVYLQWRAAQRVLDVGPIVVMDLGVWSREKSDRFRQGAVAVAVRFELISLTCRLELWARIQTARYPAETAWSTTASRITATRDEIRYRNSLLTGDRLARIVLSVTERREYEQTNRSRSGDP